MTKMGAPRKEIDFGQLEKLCAIQCTAVEIANWFNITDDTLNTRIKEKHGMIFSEYFKKYASHGKISLRRNQFKLAEKSVAMAIWLGKQYLGQLDNKTEEPPNNWTQTITIYGMSKDAI